MYCSRPVETNHKFCNKCLWKVIGRINYSSRCDVCSIDLDIIDDSGLAMCKSCIENIVLSTIDSQKSLQISIDNPFKGKYNLNLVIVYIDSSEASLKDGIVPNHVNLVTNIVSTVLRKFQDTFIIKTHAPFVLLILIFLLVTLLLQNLIYVLL